MAYSEISTLESELKKLRIQKYPDTFELGPNECVSVVPMNKEILKTVEEVA